MGPKVIKMNFGSFGEHARQISLITIFQTEVRVSRLAIS